MKLTMDRVVMGLLLLSQIAVIPGTHLLNSETLMFYMCTCLLIGSAFAFPMLRQIKLPSLFLLSLIAGLNVYLWDFNAQVLNGYFNVTLFIVGLYIMTCYIQDFKACRKWIAYGVLVNLCVYAAQYVGFNPFMPRTDEVFYGAFYGNLPRFAIYLGVTMPFLMEVSRWLLIPAILPFFAVSFQAMVLPTTLVILRPKLTKTALMALGLIIICLCVMYHATILSRFSVRFPTWEYGMSILGQNWLKGSGIGVLPWVLPGGRDQVMHSSMLQAVLGFGVLIIPMIIYWVKQFNWRTVTPAGLSILILILMSTVEYPFEVRRLWFVLMFVFANYIRENYRCVNC